MKKIFLSKKALRNYIHKNHPGAMYGYSKMLFFYILEGVAEDK